MQFNHLYIDGILDFKKAEFELNDINIFLGANNTGKSSVFRVLELLQNSLNIYKQYGIDLNFERTKLSNIKNVNTDELITFKLPFLFLGAKTLELQYQKQGALMLLNLKDKDVSIIRMEGSSCMINFEKIIQYLDDEFILKKAGGAESQNRFNFIESNTERENPNRSASTLVEKDLKSKKELLEKNWKNSFLQIGNKNKINDYLFSISSHETKLMQSLSTFLDGKEDFNYQIDSNSRRYSHSIVNIFIFLSALEVLTDKKQLSYSYDDNEFDENGEWIDCETRTVDFLAGNRDIPIFSERFRYLLDVIRLSFEKGFLDLIELLDNISYLSAIRLNTISPYIVDTNNEILNELSQLFSNAAKEQKEFINYWLQKLQLGKIDIEKATLVGLEIKVLVFYKFENHNINTKKAFTLNKLSTGTLQVIMLLMKISLSKSQSIICIEEPEVNLHPRLQTIIADILQDANKKFKMKFIIETHNEYMLSRFQNLIAEEKINIEKLSIHYFQTSTNLKPQVVHIPITEGGIIDYSIIYDDEYYPQGYNLHLSLLNKRRERFFETFERTKNLVVNGTETDEEIIYQKIDEYLINQDYSTYETVLTEKNIDISKLHSDIINLLTSGLFLQNNLANNPSSDFSPVVMQLGKAMENTIKSACKDIFTTNNFSQTKINNIKTVEGWLFGSFSQFKISSINSFQSQHLLYSLAEPTTRIELNNSYGNIINVINLNKLETNKSKFGENDVVSKIRDLRNNAAHKSEKISLTESSEHLDRVIEFFKMWIEIKK
ncbi:AAA family ATPase [Bernardetia sp. OM2101]|uniref:AAA family ATPase n=1 Tax=Bernardetia sp. OM2101 TaxID=3344876 RepID=UPI0035CF4F81